jgi:hypothetical protein
MQPKNAKELLHMIRGNTIFLRYIKLLLTQCDNVLNQRGLEIMGMFDLEENVGL